jgi:hypothetical protein
MRIINVSADLNSQKNIALQGVVPVDGAVTAEVYDAARVEAKEEKTAQETQKKGRKTKRVSTEEV